MISVETKTFSGIDPGDEGGFEDPGFEQHGGHQGSQNNGFDMNQMMQMMQMMQQNQSKNDPHNIVDQKMAMDWLNHTMSFLFRSFKSANGNVRKFNKND